MKRVQNIIITLFVGIFLFGCSSQQKQEQHATNDKPLIATSTFVLYDIVHHIGADDISLIHILPFGVDPHSFEPTPKLMAQLQKAKRVFYSGAGLEPWIRGFGREKKGWIDLSKYVHLRGTQGHYDPHYWLDFDNMKKITSVITQELITLLPEKKALLLQRKDHYIKMLTMLQQRYTQELQSCAIHTVVVGHNALGYLAQKYHFDVDPLSGLAPEAQPSAQVVAHLMDTIKQKGIKMIFLEHFVNDSVMKNIAQERGIELEVFSALGNITADEAQQKLGYKELMLRNLEKLTKALDCK